MNELLQQIFIRLGTQLTEDVFSHVPQDHANFPFVKVESLDVNNNDVDDKSGFEGTLKIFGFSRYRGSAEIGTLAQNIYDALHRWDFPDTATYSISSIHQELSTIVLESDGITRQSIQTFSIIFEPI